MKHQYTHPNEEFVPHQALLNVMQARGLRLVEMDQLVYPDDQGRQVLISGPAHSVVYLQVVDALCNVVAKASYEHALSRDRSPFCGASALPGSARQRAMDGMVKNLDVWDEK